MVTKNPDPDPAVEVQDLRAERDRVELAALQAYQRQLQARLDERAAGEEYDRLKHELLGLDQRLRGKGEITHGWAPPFGSDERKMEIVARRIQQLRERVD